VFNTINIYQDNKLKSRYKLFCVPSLSYNGIGSGRLIKIYLTPFVYYVCSLHQSHLFHKKRGDTNLLFLFLDPVKAIASPYKFLSLNDNNLLLV